MRMDYPCPAGQHHYHPHNEPISSIWGMTTGYHSYLYCQKCGHIIEFQRTVGTTSYTTSSGTVTITSADIKPLPYTITYGESGHDTF